MVHGRRGADSCQWRSAPTPCFTMIAELAQQLHLCKWLLHGDDVIFLHQSFANEVVNANRQSMRPESMGCRRYKSNVHHVNNIL